MEKGIMKRLFTHQQGGFLLDALLALAVFTILLPVLVDLSSQRRQLRKASWQSYTTWVNDSNASSW